MTSVLLFQQEIIQKIQMRRRSCSPSGQCSLLLCVYVVCVCVHMSMFACSCVLCLNFWREFCITAGWMLVSGKYWCVTLRPMFEPQGRIIRCSLGNEQ